MTHKADIVSESINVDELIRRFKFYYKINNIRTENDTIQHLVTSEIKLLESVILLDTNIPSEHDLTIILTINNTLRGIHLPSYPGYVKTANNIIQYYKDRK